MSTQGEIKHSVETVEYPTPAVQAKSEAKDHMHFSTSKLCFQPGVPLMSELPILLSRSDEPFKDEMATTTAHCLHYEVLVKILDQMDDHYFKVVAPIIDAEEANKALGIVSELRRRN